MKPKMPLFGVSVGFATAVGYLPHIVFLLLIALFQSKNVLHVFLMFTIGARVLGDWYFWSRMFPEKMDSGDNRENWRSSIKGILFSKATSIRAMGDMIIDLGVDGLLVYMAIKASANLVWIFLIFSACQAIGAFVHGMIIYELNRVGFRLFSMVVTAMATFAALEINGIIPDGNYMHIFGLSNIAKPLAALLILGAKCLLTGTSVIAKTSIAETIKMETMKELMT